MKNKERLVWVCLTVLLAIGFIFASTTPMRAASLGGGEDVRYLQMFEWIFKHVQDNYVDEVSPQQLYEGAVKGLFESLNDPYSTYLTPDDMEDFSDTTTGQFGGVGMFITKQGGPRPEITPDSTFREQNFDYVMVISPIEGSPAYKAGISAGDFIIEINEESAQGLSSDDVADLLRGAPGTEVSFRIRRRGNIELDFKLARAVIEVPTVKYTMMDDSTAYLRIIRWTPYTLDSVKEAVASFEKENYKSLIIDVRGNPGGLLSSVVDTADLFIDNGPIVSTRDRNGTDLEVFKATKRTAVAEEIEIVLLIDNGSASASEILAGALKDTGRAYLIGSTTFGKGSVQQIRGFGDGGFKLTTSRYYTPADINIDHIGIEPHKFVEEDELTDEQIEDLAEIFENNSIAHFVEKHPSADDQDTASFTAELLKTATHLDERLIRKLIWDEYNRTLNDPPLYDIEFDRALSYAYDLMKSGRFEAEFAAAPAE